MKELWWRLVRFGFRLLYQEMAWTYDAVSWVVSLGQWRAWQRAALPFISGRSVLEIAHGPGHMLLTLAQAGFAVTGVDLSPQMGRQARRRLTRHGVTVPLARAGVEALPFAAATFDTVLSTFPTEFIAAEASLAALYRVLGPGGRLVIVPEGHLTGTGPVYGFISWLFVITGQRTGREAEEPAAAHPLFTPFAKRARAAGFRIEVETVQLPRSACTVLVLTRPTGETGPFHNKK